MRRLLAALGVAACVVVATATPASAHAELRSTDPVGGAVYEAASDVPTRVRLRFSEPVVASADSVRLYDGDGTRRTIGRPEGGGAEVAADLPSLDDGVYVVTWRVVSADSHPVRGAFSFRVGDAAGGDTQALVEELLNAQGGSTAVGALYAGVRWLAFGALIVFVGGALFVFGLWPDGFGRARGVLVAGWVAALGTTAAAIALQGVYAAGLPLGDLTQARLVGDTLDTRFGQAWLVRFVLLAAAGPLALRAAGWVGARRRVALTTLAAAGAVVVATPGIGGHASADSPAAFAVALDAVHLGAVSYWLGGLVILALVALRRREADSLVGEVVRRFSATALVAVAVIFATGVLQGWRQSRSLDALQETTYGRLLLAKLVLFAGLVCLAALSRRWVRRRVSDSGPSSLRKLVMAEAAVAAAVLLVTALLVNAVPARTAYAQPASVEVRMARVLVDVTVDPAKAGPVELHLYTLTPAGVIAEVEELTLRLSLPDRDIGPLEVPLEVAGPGHFAAYDFDIPIPGQWRLSVTVRTSDIDQETATADVRIR